MTFEKFPEGLIAVRPRTLANLKRGERSAFPLYGIRMNPERNVFAFLNTELPPPLDSDREYGEIWLDENGSYHVSIPGDTKRKWKFEDLRLYEMSGEKYLAAIKTVTWEPK